MKNKYVIPAIKCVNIVSSDFMTSSLGYGGDGIGRPAQMPKRGVQGVRDIDEEWDDEE